MATDTTSESAGAEYLVLGELLVRSIEAYKDQRGKRGHDLTAVVHDRAVRIQVKMRCHDDADWGFPIKNFDSHFVVVVWLKKSREDGSLGERLFYILPTELVRQHTTSHAMARCLVNRIPNSETYRDAWHLIADGHGVHPGQIVEDGTGLVS